MARPTLLRQMGLGIIRAAFAVLGKDRDVVLVDSHLPLIDDEVLKMKAFVPPPQEELKYWLLHFKSQFHDYDAATNTYTFDSAATGVAAIGFDELDYNDAEERYAQFADQHGGHASVRRGVHHVGRDEI